MDKFKEAEKNLEKAEEICKANFHLKKYPEYIDVLLSLARFLVRYYADGPSALNKTADALSYAKELKL